MILRVLQVTAGDQPADFVGGACAWKMPPKTHVANDASRIGLSEGDMVKKGWKPAIRDCDFPHADIK